jgi:cullin 1
MYTKPPKIFQTSTYQAAILLQFNTGGDSLSYNDLREGTKINDETLKPILANFVKQRVLELKEGEMYDLNLGFKSAKVHSPDLYGVPKLTRSDHRSEST